MTLDSLETLPPSSPVTSGNRTPAIIFGFILLLPALACWLTTLVIPTLQTVQFSLQKITVLSGQTQYVGVANYTFLFSDQSFLSATTFTVFVALERLVVVAIVPLLLALALNEFGRLVRIPMRLLFSIPLTLFAPVLVLLSWRLALNPLTGLFATGETLPLASPAGARSTLLTIDAVETFALACGLGLVVYLVALRGTGSSAPTWRRVRIPLLVAWLITIIAAVAYALQTFSLGFVLTQGGPAFSTMNLPLHQYRSGFVTFNFGVGSTIATLTLIPLALLGLIAGVIAIATRLRLETVPQAKPVGLLQGQNKMIVAVFLALGIAVALAICGYAATPTLWTWLTGLQADPSAVASVSDTIQPAPALVNTFVPVATAILLVQLPVTYLAALGIGALRPLGKYSEWLLIFFSPWLFITIEPLNIAIFQTLRTAKLLNSFGALVAAPTLLNVLMLFILTFYFKGQTRKWQATTSSPQPDLAGFARTVILPSLPLALLLAGIAIATSQQDLLWPLLVTNSPEFRTVPVTLMLLSSQFATRTAPVAALIAIFGIPQFIISFALLGIFQIFYLDRLALGTGNEEPEPIVEPTPEVPAAAIEPDILGSLPIG